MDLELNNMYIPLYMEHDNIYRIDSSPSDPEPLSNETFNFLTREENLAKPKAEDNITVQNLKSFIQPAPTRKVLPRPLEIEDFNFIEEEYFYKNSESLLSLYDPIILIKISDGLARIIKEDYHINNYFSIMDKIKMVYRRGIYDEISGKFF